MVGAQTLAVALADFGQDVNPVPCLDAVIGLDVKSSLWLDNLEHLEKPRLYLESVKDDIRANDLVLY